MPVAFALSVTRTMKICADLSLPMALSNDSSALQAELWPAAFLKHSPARDYRESALVHAHGTQGKAPGSCHIALPCHLATSHR